MGVTGKSIQYSRNKAKSKNNIIKGLEKKLERLEKSLMGETDIYKIARLSKDIESTNTEIQNYMYEKKGSMLRSKARWFEEGEKSTKYFFSLDISCVFSSEWAYPDNLLYLE